jgi:hypothetical protein
MPQVLYAHGWDIDRLGLPCNQEELGYTLLTFNYVFLQGLRRLGLRLDQGDEEAYMHAWNVLGAVLGIEREQMTDTMADAERMFTAIQAQARVLQRKDDPRPALAGALMANIQRYLPLRILKPFPVLLTRHLIGKASSRDLGLDKRVSLLSRGLFVLVFGFIRGVDAIARLVFPGFSISRLVTRILGYNLTVKLLMDETRPLKLPDTLLGEVGDAVHAWHNDEKAPRWVNALERRFTGRSRPAAQQG